MIMNINNYELKKEFFSEKNKYFRINLRLINEINFEKSIKNSIFSNFNILWERQPKELFKYYGAWNLVSLIIQNYIYSMLLRNNMPNEYNKYPIVKQLDKINLTIQKYFFHDITEPLFNNHVRDKLKQCFIEINKENTVKQTLFNSPIIYWQELLTRENNNLNNNWIRFLLNYIFLQKWKKY